MQMQIVLLFILYCSARACQLNIEPNSLRTTSTSKGQFSGFCSCIGAAEDSYQFTWYRHGHLLVNTDRVRLELNRSNRILFQRILVEDEGEYVCVATARDSSISINTTLFVYVAPVLEDNKSKELSIGVGSTLELPCPIKFLDLHSILTITWVLSSNNRLSSENPQGGRFTFVTETKGLLLRDAHIADAGEYICYASNEADAVTFSWDISVIDFIGETELTTQLPSATSDNEPLSTSDSPDTTTLRTTKDTSTAASLLSSPLYITLIILAFIITCTLILITVIISITCVCAVCYHSKMIVTDEKLASCTHKTPPNSVYPTRMSDYIQKTGYSHTGPSPAISLQSLGSQIHHSTRRIIAPPPCCVTDTTSLDSPMGQSQNYLTAPNNFKPLPYHMRYPSDQGEYNFVSSQGELVCPRCCPSVTMSEPRMTYANSPRLTPKLQPKKHSLPDRIEDSHPHPLTQTKSRNSPYSHLSGSTVVHEIDV
ncbi:Immunoglobulin superfamily member 10 [Oopsacas minuta]|uniref:Immunoglobulin superfamily member 10 n=1 Tax=Oopsacas minuta TaxID=111878 RepID=A0AAV7JC74_9METZ|nr:Immunoglobulin superfamily member 10 [Oopsacas minuta]